ncbi:MAG: AmmeMemoRadiSam system radical SAM enzyme [Chloroflexi bacterium]|nr:AmmeMemoRadiSam system radical SAM enzyme [Chloroflexota bacterium]MBI3930785.1 AmmeMemoRadiSam system radical SAM enzyme [Chloroflexota bacterium]
MHEALLYEKLPNSRLQCHTCQWRCKIGPGKFGACGMYQNRDGTLYNLNYAIVSSVAADPVEKKPLFHFFPGSLVFSLGTLGCNFHCRHCQNWEISTADSSALQRGCQEMPPQAAIELAKSYQCQGVAWTYNEPSIWFEYTLDSAKLAKENGLYTVYVTNGYLSPGALDTIGPYLDAWRVDIKGFSDSFYRDLARVPRWREILEVTKRAKAKWDMHVEVVTNIIPTMNDDDQQLEGLAHWIRDELGELTPWHVTRFYPHHHLMQLPPTPITTLEHAYDIGQKAGLKFIYTGNVPGHKNEKTVCYSCGKLIVERFGYQTKLVGLEGSRCRSCGAELNFRTTSSGKLKRGEASLP